MSATCAPPFSQRNGRKRRLRVHKTILHFDSSFEVPGSAACDVATARCFYQGLSVNGSELFHAEVVCAVYKEIGGWNYS